MKITGIVSAGKRVGRTLGFPTANITPDDGMALPARDGVYAARVTLCDGRALACVLNKGKHPTLPEGAPTVEAFILDFHEDLYGQRVGVEFLAFLRPEQRFESPQALRAQIAQDVELSLIHI